MNKEIASTLTVEKLKIELKLRNIDFVAKDKKSDLLSKLLNYLSTSTTASSQDDNEGKTTASIVEVEAEPSVNSSIVINSVDTSAAVDASHATAVIPSVNNSSSDNVNPSENDDGVKHNADTSPSIVDTAVEVITAVTTGNDSSSITLDSTTNINIRSATDNAIYNNNAAITATVTIAPVDAAVVSKKDVNVAASHPSQSSISPITTDTAAAAPVSTASTAEAEATAHTVTSTNATSNTTEPTPAAAAAVATNNTDSNDGMKVQMSGISDIHTEPTTSAPTPKPISVPVASAAAAITGAATAEVAEVSDEKDTDTHADCNTLTLTRTTVRIDNFQRPLHINSLTPWLEEQSGLPAGALLPTTPSATATTGATQASGTSAGGYAPIWISLPLKTHCYVDLPSAEAAQTCIKNVVGKKYPSNSATFTLTAGTALYVCVYVYFYLRLCA